MNFTELMGISPEDFSQYEKIKGKLCLKLMNYERNRQLLLDMPHIRYYDLALGCIYLTKKPDGSGLMQSVQVRKDYLQMWNVTERDILRQAIENAPKMMIPQIMPMENIISSIPNYPIRPSRNNMYILTNKERFLGSVCMTFPGVLSDFAKEMGSDLIILPSSTHEVIIMADDGTDDDPDRYNRIINAVNDKMVDPIDRLSDHFYRFSRADLKLWY